MMDPGELHRSPLYYPFPHQALPWFWVSPWMM
jgi:hypothetical protein